jgi:hypothetical protein
VQLRDHPGVVLAQRVSTVNQNPQHRQLLIVDHRPQPTHPGAEHRDGVRVGHIGLAALAGDQHPGPCRQLRRHVHDRLTKRDRVAAHADAELRLAGLPTSSEGVAAAIAAGLSYFVGAALPLALMHWLPLDHRIEVTFISVLVALMLTGWFASWLTGLPALRLIIRNVALGTVTMAGGLLLGLIIKV